MRGASTPPRGERTWTRIALQTVLALVGICLLLLGIRVSLAIPKGLRQHSAVASLRKMGGHVDYDCEVNPPWLQDAFANVERVLCQRVDDDSIVVLEALARVTSLDVSESGLSDFGLTSVVKLKGLQELNLSHTRIGDAGLAVLKALTDLKKLNVSGTSVTGAGIEELKELKNLEELDVSSTKVTGNQLSSLREFSCLRRLNLSNTALMCAARDEADAPAALANAANKVFSERPPNIPVRVTVVTETRSDAGVKLLGSMGRLRGLNLGVTGITDAGMVYVASLKQIERLNLAQNNGISDRALEQLKGLASLQDLDLSGTKVTDAGLECLKASNNLRDLCVSDTAISDTGLEHLKGMTQLIRLDLDGTKVTDRGLKRLAGFRQLQDLGLRGTATTSEGVKNLQTALPRCEIRR